MNVTVSTTPLELVCGGRSDAEDLLADVRAIAPGATVRKAYYRKEQLIVPDSFDAPGAASDVDLVLHEPSQEQAKATPKPSSSPQPPAVKPTETSPADEELFYSSQLGSFTTKTDAKRTYMRIKDLPDPRIERIGKTYTARFG